MFVPWIVLALQTSALPQTASCGTLCWDISPQICITEQADQACHSTLQLSWRSDTPLSPCVYLAEQKLFCWQNASEGHWQQLLHWQDAMLTLRDENNQVLLQTPLQVQSRRPARRRLSSPWSIF